MPPSADRVPARGLPVRGLPDPLPAIIGRLVADLRVTLGAELIGAYSYGSAIVGDFDPERSDLDVCVVTRSSVEDLPMATFEGIVERLAEREPAWAHRLDIVFVGGPTLARFREGGPLVSISHDDPLRRSDDADSWLQTWFLVREARATVVGPAVEAVVPPIDLPEFTAAVAADADRIQGQATSAASDDLLAYILLTHARVLAALDGSGVVSKPRAAELLRKTHPRLADAIDAALRARAGSPITAPERSALLGATTVLAGEIARRR
jgi:Domain of unknown function (DUF4111)